MSTSPRLNDIRVGDRVEVSHVTEVLGLRVVPEEPSERDVLLNLGDGPTWFPLGVCTPFPEMSTETIQRILERTTAEMLIEETK